MVSWISSWIRPYLVGDLANRGCWRFEVLELDVEESTWDQDHDTIQQLNRRRVAVLP